MMESAKNRCGFQRAGCAPMPSKARAVPPDKRVRANDEHGSGNRRERPIEPDEEEAVAVRKIYPAAQPAPQYEDLLAKRCVITGATGALANTIARKFASEGARLALLDKVIDKERVPPGPSHLVIEVDLLDRNAVAAGLAKLDHVVVLCNIAAVYDGGQAVHETSLDWLKLATRCSD